MRWGTSAEIRTQTIEWSTSTANVSVLSSLHAQIDAVVDLATPILLLVFQTSTIGRHAPSVTVT